jgi:hypothetical protein
LKARGLKSHVIDVGDIDLPSSDIEAVEDLRWPVSFPWISSTVQGLLTISALCWTCNNSRGTTMMTVVMGIVGIGASNNGGCGCG